MEDCEKLLKVAKRTKQDFCRESNGPILKRSESSWGAYIYCKMYYRRGC